jgi:uncharacterized CHY-type Zn-finger protein
LLCISCPCDINCRKASMRPATSFSRWDAFCACFRSRDSVRIHSMTITTRTRRSTTRIVTSICRAPSNSSRYIRVVRRSRNHPFHAKRGIYNRPVNDFRRGQSSIPGDNYRGRVGRVRRPPTPLQCLNRSRNGAHLGKCPKSYQVVPESVEVCKYTSNVVGELDALTFKRNVAASGEPIPNPRLRLPLLPLADFVADATRTLTMLHALPAYTSAHACNISKS